MSVSKYSPLIQKYIPEIRMLSKYIYKNSVLYKLFLFYVSNMIWIIQELEGIKNFKNRIHPT